MWVLIGYDGYFWIEVMVNGEVWCFMVDIGVMLIVVFFIIVDVVVFVFSMLCQLVFLCIVNGIVIVDLVMIVELCFGNVVVCDFDVVVVFGIGEINVIGMNLFLCLVSWWVEGYMLILVFKYLQVVSGI